MVAKKYDEDNIQVLKDVEAIRVRPGMYIGDIRKGTQQLFIEVVANAIDEFNSGFGDRIEILINSKKSQFEVRDYGRGIPSGKLTDIMCKLHSGGKFNRKSYSVGAAGLHGCGLTCVNALSDKTIVEVFRDGKHFMQEYSKGKPVSEVEFVAKTKETGTKVFFHPDKEIFEDITVDPNVYIEMIKLYAFLNPNLEFELEIDGKKDTIISKDGLLDFIKTIPHKSILKEPINIRDEKEYDKNGNPITMELDVLIDYDNTREEELVHSFVNGVPTTENGTHVTGALMAISSFFTKFIKENNMVSSKSKIEITPADVKECLILVISAKHSDPLFVSQTKKKLSNQDIQDFGRSLVTKGLEKISKDRLNVIAKLIIDVAKGRMAARNAKLAVKKVKKDFITGLSKYDKFTPCTSKDPEERELYIVEGASASGSLVEGRNPKINAIYRLRGKPLNSHGKDTAKLLNNAEMSDISILLGTGIGKNFNYDKLNFNKIVICADADSDGQNIIALIANLFLQHYPELMEKGHIYVARPPLYSLSTGRSKKKKFIISKSELADLIVQNIVKEFSVSINDKKLNKSQLTEFIYDTSQYLYELKKEAGKFALDEELYERIAILFHKYGKQFEKIIQRIINRYKDMKVTNKESFLLEGVIRNKFQIVRLDDKELIRSISKLIKYYDSNDGADMVVVNGKKSTYGNFLKSTFEMAIPKNTIFERYKGLGSLEAEDLAETILNPETRVIERLIVPDKDKALEMAENLFGNDPDVRKQMLLDFVINPEEIDS